MENKFSTESCEVTTNTLTNINSPIEAKYAVYNHTNINKKSRLTYIIVILICYDCIIFFHEVNEYLSEVSIQNLKV